MEIINTRIRKEICNDTISSLKDENLLNEYKECKSVKNEIKKLNDILIKYVSNEIKDLILKEYLKELIPAGTKGVIKGNKFNCIVKKLIIDMKFNPIDFEIAFEKQCDKYTMTEIPDWYILNLKTNKIILGMNQLDLWGGGAQTNRGSKYVNNENFNNENCKLLCVVCNEIQFKTNRSKPYKMFELGFRTDTLCYIKNLEKIIREFLI
jgi:hypothetical protein